MLAGADSVMYVTASAAGRPMAAPPSGAGHARHDKRYGTYRQRTPYSRNEEERAADNKDTFPAESVGKESGGGRSDDGTEHDGGNDEALHESTEPVSGAQEFDGTGDGDGVVAVQ